MDTYSQSAEGVTITRARALRELAKHGLDGSEGSVDAIDFDAFMGGRRETYEASDVLAWLGY